MVSIHIYLDKSFECNQSKLAIGDAVLVVGVNANNVVGKSESTPQITDSMLSQSHQTEQHSTGLVEPF